MAEAESVTALLSAWGQGSHRALDKLVPLVERDLRRVARRLMRCEPAGHTLQTTALMNEAYLRLIQSGRVRLRDRVHFFAVATTLMRRILVDHARAKRNQKRGGQFRRVPLLDAFVDSGQCQAGLVELDAVLDALATIDPRRSRVVELRIFGGLTVEETGQALGISAETVMRDWKLARVWLRRELQRRGGDGS